MATPGETLPRRLPPVRGRLETGPTIGRPDVVSRGRTGGRAVLDRQTKKTWRHFLPVSMKTFRCR
jgi:hypothetical protein